MTKVEGLSRRRSLMYGGEHVDDTLKDGSKRDINIAKFIVDNVIGGVEDSVQKKEEQRDYKMKIDFEREKDLFLNQQAEFKNKIETIAMNNLNEKMINFMKDEKNNQQDLFNKYYTLNSEIVSKIKKIKESLPELENKVKNKKDKLKDINHENLRLLERINQIEAEKRDRAEGKEGSMIIKLNNSESLMIDKTMKEEIIGNTIDRMDISRIAANRSLLNRRKGQNPNNQSINISELIEDNESLKQKFENLKILKDKQRLSKKENKFLSNEIALLNTVFFNQTKIFTEGIHEISKELMKIHEIQLDKIVHKNATGNSLYFELMKDRSISNINGSFNILDEQMKLPVINNNIQKKYNFPVNEKSEPNTSIYNVIKNMLEEHHSLNRSLNLKRRKFEWEEFRQFSAYQIYTLIGLNREVLKKLENKIFPRKYSNLAEEISVYESINKINNLNQNNSNDYQ